MDRKVLIPSVVMGVAIMAAVAATVGNVSANGAGNRDQAAQTLAEKLGVDKTRVDAAFDEMHQERQAERQKEISTNLDKAVSDGVITADQKQKILDKQAERRAQMERQRAETDQWFKDNGIDSDRLYEYIGRGNGMGKGYSRGMRYDDAGVTSDSRD
ncbi:MAG: hypothetical protein WCT32_03575 [Patescibacteria group bacterium]|jgi:hypothetical protein